MTITNYKSYLAAAAGAKTFVYGYSWDVNVNHKAAYPIIRATPKDWGLPRGSSFKIKQEFVIYNINADAATSWDECISIWNTYKGLLNSQIVLDDVDSVDLLPLGETVENGQAIKIVANLTIWC